MMANRGAHRGAQGRTGTHRGAQGRTCTKEQKVLKEREKFRKIK